MTRHRLRIRFRKEGDLRMISHRDLACLWERMFRRAGVSLAMSEGFHPKAKLSFPSALSLGVAGLEEVLEADLAEEAADDEVPTQLLERLRVQAPAGLAIESIERLPPGQRKAQVARLTYEVPVPADCQAAVQQNIDALFEQPQVWVERADRAVAIDVRATLEELVLEEGRLKMRFRAGREAAARPRDVLQLLGLGDIEHTGAFLTRTRVELT